MNHVAFRTLASTLFLAGFAGIPSAAQVGVGSWSTAYDWECQINDTVPFNPLDPPSGGCGRECGSFEFEFVHAALIPKGPRRGQVLLWRKEVPYTGMDPCRAGDQLRSWIFNPNDPDCLGKIDQPLSSSLFCAGQTWDKYGQLTVAGGIPSAPGNPFPNETYRFRPQYLSGGNPPYSPLPPPNSPPAPWKQVGNMIIQRYYATLMALGIEALKTSMGVDLDASSVIVAGGSPVVMGSIEGNEYWELLPPALSGTTPWYPPFLPKDPTLVDATYGSTMWRWGQTTTPEGRLNSPHYEEFPPSPPGNYDPYARPGTPYADRLFDTYPRMFQTTEGSQILVSGDVEEGAAANEPGTVWVIKPRTVSNQGSQSIWQSWIGPEGADPGSLDIWHDSFYDNAVLLHELGMFGRDRVLMFCGSRDKNAENVSPDPLTRNWAVNTKVWEFEKQGSSLL